MEDSQRPYQTNKQIEEVTKSIAMRFKRIVAETDVEAGYTVNETNKSKMGRHNNKQCTDNRKESNQILMIPAPPINNERDEISYVIKDMNTVEACKGQRRCAPDMKPGCFLHTP